jgi:hypothetical protein
MESDSIRAIGDSTLVEVWINGKFRAITVSRRAIQEYLQLTPEQRKALTEADRVEFVRTRLGLVTGAAAARLRENPSAESITIDDLSGLPPASPRGEDRRAGGDRRKGDRRKRNIGPPGGIERRR